MASFSGGDGSKKAYTNIQGPISVGLHWALCRRRQRYLPIHDDFLLGAHSVSPLRVAETADPTASAWRTALVVI